MNIYSNLFSVFVIVNILNEIKSVNALYPRESTTREVKSLDGIWNFRESPINDQLSGFRQNWFRAPLETSGNVIRMPVPSSYNDITQERSLRDYLGWVWYDTSFNAYDHWKIGSKRIILRFGSVNYVAVVYVNGINVVNHTGGHLPFEADITNVIHYDKQNLVTVAVNNTLTPDTVPQGSVDYKKDGTEYPPNFYEVHWNFDFFNYAGIHRSVHIYIIPATHITDVNVITGISKDRNNGVLDYSIVFESTTNVSNLNCEIQVLNKFKNETVALNKGCSGSTNIQNAMFWWPIGMNANPGYLYNFKAMVKSNGELLDEYDLKIGIRTVQITDSQFLINDKPFYFMGFGKHEDSHIRGRGLDLPLIVKDFNLLKWIGANAFRTSHYPYSEELMDEADSQGFVVIDECPAVGLHNFNQILLKLHNQTISELITRDKNRPSVVMWSIANEPRSQQPESHKYFSEIIQTVKILDKTRPVTAALNAPFETDKLGELLDVIMINRYYGWYEDTGYPQVIKRKLIKLIENWRKLHKKPIMMSEYGADSIVGLHQDPSFVFTEDYQNELIMNNHEAFDVLRTKNYFVGELIWNFADFMTAQGINRVFGNRKGVFTRERHPKAAAKILRCRYHYLNNSTSRQQFEK
ncbi:Beta-glucuronidase-like protein [Leptotrombidium deliense]|uniref:Beta-glucuronidase n=1 Tax=Leptotrombidium deliense TaxID=299467 RepID=A0A443SFV7_9ACAR|nr:Beta-glucuronidase-like protein [Leptotrombidium deliense]